MENHILSGAEARKKVKAGIDKTANAVKVTLGARGRNVMLVKSSGPAHITKDGVTVADSIYLEDPLERTGSNLVKEVAIQTVLAAGDGTTTSTILFQELVDKGCKFLEDEKVNVTDLNKGISDAVKYVCKFIKEKSIAIDNDLKLLTSIAAVAANNDRAIGDLIAKAISKVGADGTISVFPSKGPESSYRIVQGMQYARGYLANEFVTNTKKNLAVLKNPYILISERPLMQLKPLAPIMNKIYLANEKNGEKRPLLIIAPEVDMEALALLVGNHKNNVIQICAVQCPGQGLSMEDYTKDLAIYTNSFPITEEKNIKIESAELEHLGGAELVEVGVGSTLIIGGHGSKEAIEDRVESIKSLMDGVSEDALKQPYKERISSITCGVALLYVGSGSATESRERIDRVDDAIKACRSANEEGYVAGSGSTYNAACFSIPMYDQLLIGIANNKKVDGKEVTSYQKGLYCVYSAIQSITHQIYKNAGKTFDKTERPPNIYKDEYGKGYDAREDEICNLFEKGIIDPAKVLRVALQNAASVATTFLTTEVVSYSK